MKRVLKSSLVFVICLNLILFSCLSVLADEHGGTSGSFGDTETSVNMWQSSMWSDNFPNVDFSTLGSSYDFFNDRVSDYPSEFQVVMIKPNSGSSTSYSSIFNTIHCFGNAENYEDFYLRFPEDYEQADLGQYYSCNSSSFSLSNLPTQSSKYYYSVSTSTFLSTSNVIVICNSAEWYDYMITRAFNADTSHLFFYPGNILENFLDFVNADTYYDVNDVSGNYIKYYSWFDSYKGKDNVSFYGENDIRNYLNSSVSFEDDLFYEANVDNVEIPQELQHKEEITFYLKPNSDFQEHFRDIYGGTSLNNPSWLINKTDTNGVYIYDYLNQHTLCKHYKQGTISFSSWVDLLKIKCEVFNDRFEQGTFYVKFILNNSYSSIGSIFSGEKVESNALPWNDGSDTTGLGLNGFGGSLSSETPTKNSLRGKGWKNGYPNQSGSYPYCITASKNGQVLLKIYLKSKPPVVSYAYTDSQIKYTVDLKGIAGYVYYPDYNLSKEFDMSVLQNINSVDLDRIINGFSAGVTAASLATGNLTLEVVSVVFDLLQLFVDLDINISLIKSFKMVLWTNYSGRLTNGQYNGYYITFNWDIGTDPTFSRANSSDSHDYSDDYQQDHAPGTEQPTESGTESGTGSSSSGGNTYNTWNYYYYDNNGNVHGGGDQTYTPTEAPTQTSNLSFNNGGNYDFAGDLVGTSSTFFDFLKATLSFFPAYIWALIALGITILIALRILGR